MFSILRLCPAFPHPVPAFPLFFTLPHHGRFFLGLRKKGEDLERNDGSPERPYYMSPELSEILLKGNLEPSKSTDSQG